jgi:hypothetical protein
MGCLICCGEVVGSDDRRAGAHDVLKTGHFGPEIGPNNGIPDQLGGSV